MRKLNNKRKQQVTSIVIYIVTIFITIFILGIAAFIFADKFIFSDFKKEKVVNKTDAIEYRPDIQNDQLILFGIKNDDSIESLMIIKISPYYNEVLCCPVPISTVSKVQTSSQTLKRHYEKSGISALCQGVQNAYNIPVKRYMIMDYADFNYVVEKMGGASFSLPANIEYQNPDTKENVSFRANDTKTVFYGDDLRQIIACPDFIRGAEFTSQLSGTAIVTLINQSVNLKDKILENADEYTLYMIENCDTNITEYDYSSAKDALIWMIENFKQSTSYIMPDGEFKENEFIVSPEFNDKLTKYLYLEDN